MQQVQARDGPSSGAAVVFLSPLPPWKNQLTGPRALSKPETGWPWVRGAVLRQLLFQFLLLIMCTPSYTHTDAHWQGQSTHTHIGRDSHSHTHTLAGTVSHTHVGRDSHTHVSRDSLSLTHTHTRWQGQSFPGLRVDMVQWVYFRSQDGGSLLRSSGLGWATSLGVPLLDLT